LGEYKEGTQKRGKREKRGKRKRKEGERKRKRKWKGNKNKKGAKLWERGAWEANIGILSWGKY
jgi:hypothetical protein